MFGSVEGRRGKREKEISCYKYFWFKIGERR
jgi:hypothetical protein